MDLKLDSAFTAIFFKSNPLIFVFKQIFIFFVHMGRLAIIDFLLALFDFDGIHFKTPMLAGKKRIWVWCGAKLVKALPGAQGEEARLVAALAVVWDSQWPHVADLCLLAWN